MPGNQRRTRQAQSFRKECLSERTDTTESIGFLKFFYLPCFNIPGFLRALGFLFGSLLPSAVQLGEIMSIWGKHLDFLVFHLLLSLL